MTTKRKAEIQRKLTLASIPRPPKGLAEKIKADIPKYLNVESERERFSRSIGFNLRIAASIIVLVSSLFAMLYVLNEQEPAAKSMARAPQPQPTTIQRATDEVNVEIVQQAAEPVQVAEVTTTAAAAAPPPPARALSLASRRDREAAVEVEGGVEGRVEGGLAGGFVGGVTGGTARAREEVIAYAPEVAPAPAPVPPPAPPPAEPAAVAPQTARATSAPSLVPEAFAADLTLTPKSVFGLTIDPEVFRRIKSTIEKGSRPAPAMVNVEALVNYFAGAPAKRVKRGV
ncbi:MAG TPA: hypothetical protein VG106_14490, partial [Vicinamibacterales bacterium]|nr:hypothetical protein [Vicinamibacterales bacterium]